MTVAMLLFWMAFGFMPKDIPPDGFLVFSILAECLFAIGGGYVAALIAGRKELFHTGLLAGIFAAFGVLLFLGPHNGLPWWANLATTFPIAPCFLLGGLLRMKTKKTRT